MALAVVKPYGDERGTPEPLVISRPTETDGSVFTDAIVQRYCSLHVRGSIAGSLTIEPGADVLVDGSVHGKIINRGGRLVVNHKGLTACVAHEGPPESEAGATLTINLTAIAYNYDRLAKRTDAECAAVLECNAYGCGVDWIAAALAKSGCRTFFVTNLAEARRVRTAAPDSTIYVMHGLHADAAPLFANLNVRPVINSALQLAEWHAFASSDRWSGGCALNVDTGANGLGLSMEEAAELSAEMNAAEHDIALLMSTMAKTGRADHSQSERQLALFNDLRRLYHGIPASLAGAAGILLDRKTHFELVRADTALFGV
ncbi:MAG TPA: alanine racemase, partial [Xanthobacteraceae bacterium]|nr:alanine racemase [Xanthobacteraceae bacterium]